MFRYLVLLLAAVALAVVAWFGLGARYTYHLTASRQLRVDRISGNVQVWDRLSGSWVLFAEKQGKSPLGELGLPER